MAICFQFVLLWVLFERFRASGFGVGFFVTGKDYRMGGFLVGVVTWSFECLCRAPQEQPTTEYSTFLNPPRQNAVRTRDTIVV